MLIVFVFSSQLDLACVGVFELALVNGESVLWFWIDSFQMLATAIEWSGEENWL